MNSRYSLYTSKTKADATATAYERLLSGTDTISMLGYSIYIDLLLPVILGASSSFSLPPFNLFLINFLTYSIFFIFLFKKLSNKFEKKKFFYYGWLFGFGYFLTNIYWITISLTFDQDLNFLVPVALILIPAFLALFYGTITFLFYIFNFKNVTSAFFLFSLLFGLVEYIRGNILTGFPWNLIVYSFADKTDFLSFLSVIGTYSLNLLVISFFIAPAIFILRQSKKEIVVSILFLLLPILLLTYGASYKNFFLNKELKENPYTVRAVSSNISLDKFYQNVDTKKVINEMINLSSPDPKKKIFFIWPEGIIPDTYQDQLILYSDLFKSNFTKNHLVGIGITNRLKNKEQYQFFNSFSVFGNNVNLIKSYNKVNLVPFGEFIPFESFLNKIGLRTITNSFGSFTKGEQRKIIQFKNDFEGLSFLPLICYEIIYSGKLTKNFNFDYILNISEDGWFGNSTGPHQHLAHSIFRAIESGKYVIRSANNGMAAVLNPLGEIEQKINFGEDGYIDFNKKKNIDKTFFSTFGNLIFVFLILLYIFLIISFNRVKNE